MEQNRTGHGKFNPLESEAEPLMMNPGFLIPPVGLSDSLKLIQDLQACKIELERQNKELHRSQQELMKSKICYTELYDTAPVGYFTLDLQGTILNANLTLAGMLLMERSSLLNHQIMDYIFFEDHEIYYRHLKNLDVSKSRQICELRMQKKDGAIFEVQLETIFIAARCKASEQYRTVVIDISARRRAERDKEKLQTKLHQVLKKKSMETVTGGIAHNFNNILQIILGNVHLISEEVPKLSPAHVNLKRIKFAALKAADVVNQLIDFSHRNNGDLRPMEVVSSIKDALEHLRPLIPPIIDIIRHFPDKKVIVLADRIQMDRILTNLCTNALQAMAGTGGQLEIRVETKHLIPTDIDNFSDLTSGEYAKITVRDTGSGIHPEIISQIFDPYFTTRGFENGSGMGLAIVHSIAKNHNGNIMVESQPGKGTAFILMLPLIAENPEDETQLKDKISSEYETFFSESR